MLHAALVFFVAALVASIFGFAELAGAASTMRVPFLGCMVLATISLVVGLSRR